MKTMKISVVNRDPDFMASEIIYPYRLIELVVAYVTWDFPRPVESGEGVHPWSHLLAERFEHDEWKFFIHTHNYTRVDTTQKCWTTKNVQW